MGHNILHSTVQGKRQEMTREVGTKGGIRVSMGPWALGKKGKLASEEPPGRGEG